MTSSRLRKTASASGPLASTPGILPASRMISCGRNSAFDGMQA
jgi:hypothetical protein